MKNTLRVLPVLFVMALLVSAMAGCGGTAQPATTTAPTSTQPTTEATEASTPFVAPPDEMGLVVSADNQLITWQPYSTDGDVIDFKSVNTKSLGMAGEMSVFYLAPEVTFYSLVDGSLTKTTVDEVVPGSVVGITTLEEGVQEVYILSVPAADDDYDEEDPLEDDLEENLTEGSAAETTPTVEDDLD